MNHDRHATGAYATAARLGQHTRDLEALADDLEMIRLAVIGSRRLDPSDKGDDALGALTDAEAELTKLRHHLAVAYLAMGDVATHQRRAHKTAQQAKA